MKKLLSTKYSASAFNTALFLLRIGAGALMASHGYQKLVKFQTLAPKFMNFMGIGQTTSLALVIFAEFFCAILVILGLFTRLAVIPILVTMVVAIVQAHHSDIFGEAKLPSLYFISFLTILLVGPGRASIDGLVNK